MIPRRMIFEAVLVWLCVVGAEFVLAVLVHILWRHA